MKNIRPTQRDKFNKAIGGFLKSLRLAAGLTRIQAAEAVGMSLEQIRNYECGTASPPADLFAKLVDLYEGDRREIYRAVDAAARFLRVHS